MPTRSSLPEKLATLFNLRRDEVRPVLLSGAFFFCVLTALMLLRPARDALGMQRGIETVRWLFVGTALVTLLANPAFGWLVSRYRRLYFIAATYVFFAASLAGFFLLLALAPAAVGRASGMVFYVWFSVFNLFATMLFWALMADRFTLEQSRRFFALIAVGGTLGAMFGPWLASVLARPLGTPALLLVSAAFLLLALSLAALVARSQPASAPAAATDGRAETNGAARTDAPGAAGGAGGAGSGRVKPDDAESDSGAARANDAGDEAGAENRSIIGGSAWQGIAAVFRSRYLAGIAAYVILMSIMATLLYFTRLQMVAALGPDTDLRTTVFARIDLATQAATLVLQALLAGRLMRRFGVSVTLALLPVTAALGFVGLAIVGSLATLVVFQATFSAVQRALARPARETLYTVVPREDKYKAKAFIDTFAYRGGDVAGAQIEGLAARLGLGLIGLAGVALPLALIWGMLGLWLGRAQQRTDRPQDRSPASSANPPPSPDRRIPT